MLAKKSLGQNFLSSAGLISNLIEHINPQKSDSMLEIGPGQGALTWPLLQYIPQLQAIELDNELCKFLQKHPQASKLNLINQDVLQTNWEQFPKKLRIVGNLPYNISSQIIYNLSWHRGKVCDLHFMLQQELAQRLVALPGNRAYGKLSALMQYYFRIELLMSLPPSAFNPAPKVWSSFVRFIPRIENCNDPDFENFLSLAFAHKRKILSNNIGDLKIDWSKTQINPKMRAEQLSLAEFWELYRCLR